MERISGGDGEIALSRSDLDNGRESESTDHQIELDINDDLME